MNTLKTLFLLAVGLSAAQCRSKRSLNQFRDMIMCVDPESTPILSYTNYGCFCGFGGSGTPVDDLDRCCQVHDQCYYDARHHSKCSPIFDIPHLEIYDYSCDEENHMVTCGSKNDECEMFICECDRKAAECFHGTTVNPEYVDLSSAEHC